MVTRYDAPEAAVQKLSHPGSKQTIEVADEQVPMYASQGWVKASAAAKKKTDTTASKGDRQ